MNLAFTIDFKFIIQMFIFSKSVLIHPELTCYEGSPFKRNNTDEAGN